MILKLVKKNFIQWRRSFVGSFLEVVLPVLLIIGFSFLMKLNTLEYHPRQNYDEMNYFFPFLKSDILLPKKCWVYPIGGKIALIPQNSFTEQLAWYYKNAMLDTVFFQNEQEMNEYISRPDYNEVFENGTMKQLCYALYFKEFDETNHRYEYHLRFNVSNQFYPDHYHTTWDKKITYQPDYVGYSDQLRDNGVLFIQTLVESFILKNTFKFTDQKIGFTKMPTKEFFVEPREYLQIMCTYLFIFFSSFTYLKTISSIVSDRETKNLENMEAMGMTRTAYLTAYYIWIITKQVLFSLLITVTMKIFVLSFINFWFIFLLYFIFSTNITLIAIIISCFFINTKKGLVYGIIFFFALQIPFIIHSKFGDSALITNLLGQSPFANMGMTFYGIQIAQNYHESYTIDMLFLRLGYFHGYLFFVYNLIQMALLGIFSFFLFNVISHDSGVPSNPLFFLGRKKSRSSNLRLSALRKNSKGLEEPLID